MIQVARSGTQRAEELRSSVQAVLIGSWLLPSDKAGPLLEYCLGLGVEEVGDLKFLREEHVEELVTLAPSFVAKERLRALISRVRGSSDGGGGGGGGGDPSVDSPKQTVGQAQDVCGGAEVAEAAAALATTEATSLESLLARARTAEEAKDYVKAAELNGEVCTRNPTYLARVWLDCGFCLGEGPTASDPAVVAEREKCYRKAIELNPKLSVGTGTFAHFSPRHWLLCHTGLY